MDPVKVSAALGTVLVAGATTYGVSTLWNTPSWTHISLDDGTLSSKYADNYRHYFVGATDENKNWWSWSLKNRWSKDKNDSDESKRPGFGFKDVLDDWKKLKEKCDEAYKKQISEISKTTSETQYLERDVWRYCSPGFAGKPTTVQEKDSTTYQAQDDSYGKTQGTKLISVTDENNDWFWQIQQDRFFGIGRYQGITAEGSSGINKDTDSLFHALYESGNSHSRSIVKEICKEAYFVKTTKEENKPTATQANVFKFCSLEGK
ncbi:hypothetical protein [Candidatus Mycoplasma haematohominis]|uniref:Uncharacterized protein n=1 Tax=Candidatus Mycoplasma haematohominis TaxID=1494318 RepID=A0A478FQ56_9MOLU|nr:hypothetical protein [Candidatus Mycoplasma haemohominis]GCE63573.1 hypothetical protein MHSWG343_05700 [Candidatus Mycoplasma haemohominis]